MVISSNTGAHSPSWVVFRGRCISLENSNDLLDGISILTKLPKGIEEPFIGVENDGVGVGYDEIRLDPLDVAPAIANNE